MLFPDYIFETSWEVCNKVGGIYTVLSTRAKTLQDSMKDRIIFLGPDCWHHSPSPYFRQDDKLFADWQKALALEGGPSVKIGRWDIPGEPIAMLVDYQPLYALKNELFGKLWEDYHVDSLHAYGDYDESAVFAYATALVVESFYHFYLGEQDKVVFHANEWQTGFAALVLQQRVPQIASIFTTHATCIGRSIAGNNKPLYEYLWAYNGDQMAGELNMVSKHSIEKQTAHHVDCFTTVSEITAQECKELLDKPVDVVLPNGFENDFVPKDKHFDSKRQAARKRLLSVANALIGSRFDDDTLIVSTSGRYEFRNKGIDVFIESMNRLRHDQRLEKNVVAFIEVPGWLEAPRQDLIQRLESDRTYDTPLELPMLTHWLHNIDSDNVIGMMRGLGMHNDKHDKVKLIFVPCYLTGKDGVMNMEYYDLVLGNDLCVYPSYYEPWGYTPLEAIAFKIPCITTDLAGFGLWANSVKGAPSTIEDGVEVLHRTDYNYSEVADGINETIVRYASLSQTAINACRTKAERLSHKALWSQFITYYERAYDIALQNAAERTKKYQL